MGFAAGWLFSILHLYITYRRNGNRIAANEIYQGKEIGYDKERILLMGNSGELGRNERVLRDELLREYFDRDKMKKGL